MSESSSSCPARWHVQTRGRAKVYLSLTFLHRLYVSDEVLQDNIEDPEIKEGQDSPDMRSEQLLLQLLNHIPC